VFVGYVGTLDTNHSPAFGGGPGFDMQVTATTATCVVGGSLRTLSRVYDPANPIVGSWISEWASGTGALVVTYLSDGHYVMGHGGVADANGQPGVEFGTYTWNSGTGAWTATAGQPDTNGDWGFSCPNGVRGATMTSTVTISGNEMTMMATNGTTPYRWRRVGVH
jgi:hypothetical protein